MASSPFLSSLAHHAADPFRLLVESVVEYAIFMLDPAGCVASWNPAAARIFGYEAEEIIGRHYSCFYSEAEQAAGEPGRVLDLARQSGDHSVEILRTRKDGSQFWAITTVSDLKDYFGNHAGYAEVTRDITERKLAQASVDRERDLAAAILGSLPGVYYMYDETGRFLRWNRQFEVVTECSTEEIGRMHPLDFFDEKDKVLLAERIETVFRTGSCEVEASFVSKSGRHTFYYFNGVRAVVDGQPCLLGMGIDISARRRSEEALRATDQRFRQAAAAANVGLWDWDLRTNEVLFSPEWKSQLGYRDYEIGNSFDEWQSRVHPEDLQPALEGMRAFIADPSERYQAEFRLRHRDGSYRWILSQASLLFSEQGVPIRMLGSHVDVTERRHAEKQRQQAQKMESIGQLAAGVAHDFNNLLTVINGYSEILMKRLSADDPMYRVVSTIREAGAQAGTLTRQLLTFTRHQAVELRILDLNKVVEDTGKMLQRLIGQNITLTMNRGGNLDAIKADQSQLLQILFNLVINARDSMPRGGRITIETRNVELDGNALRGAAPGRYVMLSVNDNGCGMDESVRAQIFEPFFTTKAAGQGTGLGLATVHSIVEQSHGYLAVDSEVGRGSTFRIYFPQAAGRQEPSLMGVATIPSGNETILLAEDDDSVRPMASHVLSTCGYKVCEATDGADALRLATAHAGSIDLLISNVVMPHVGGIELAEKITASHPECKVLLLSGSGNNAAALQNLNANRFGVLQKPFAPSLLAQKVRGLLDGSKESPCSGI